MPTSGRKICIALLSFSFLHLTCSRPSDLMDTKKCKKSTGVFPKRASSCRSFYRCSNWIPQEVECPLDQHFFPAKGYCVWPEEFPCLDRPGSEQCPERKGKFLKKGTNCKVYYDCCDGRATEKRCAGDTLFDSSSKKCDWPELVACPDDRDPGYKECPSANGNFLKTGSECKYYYECNNFKPTVKKCWGDTLFDHTTGKCDWPELVECADDATTTKTIFSSTLASTTSTELFTPSSSSKDIITAPITPTSYSISSKTPTPVSDENSSEGKSSEESKEYTTQHRTKSTYPSIFSVSRTILEKTTTPSVFTEDFKETPSSTKISTDPPVTSYKPSSTVATNTETRSRITTVLEVSTVSEMTTGFTSRNGTTTYPAVLTDRTSAKTTLGLNFRNKDWSTTFSSLTDTVTYDILCPKPDGHFPHPSNKHKFIACVGGNPTVMDCPSKLVYDHKTNSCQWS